MAYSKLIKACVDYALGFQTVNQAIENLRALHDGLAAEHGYLNDIYTQFGLGGSPNSGAGGGGGLAGLFARVTPYDDFGRHNSAKIPRGVMSCNIVNSSGDGMGVDWSSGAAFGSIQYRGSGTYFLPVSGLSTFWGEVTARDGAAVFTSCWPVYSVSPGQSGLMIEIGTFVATGLSGISGDGHISFTVTIFGEV